MNENYFNGKYFQRSDLLHENRLTLILLLDGDNT